MPGLDGTGPVSMGAMTGGGYGICPGAHQRGTRRGAAYGCGAPVGGGRGLAMRRGYGRGLSLADHDNGIYYYAAAKSPDSSEADNSPGTGLEELRRSNEELSQRLTKLAEAVDELSRHRERTK